VKIVSFSGIDGAGKSTQINALRAWLGQVGLSVQLLTFWDNVVAFPRFRECMSNAAFNGDQGIGSPDRPLHRRDKNVTSWPVSVVRFGLYFLDAINLCRATRRVKKSGTDVVIFDRYIYDELANLPLSRWLARAFIRALLRMVPRPDIAYLIDADPVAAVARKPEYPLEFLRRNREAYLTLSRLEGGITVIEPLSIEMMETKIRNVFLQKLQAPEEGFSGLPALP
jgi:thymidylate kinase